MENRTYPREWFGVIRWSTEIEVLQFQRETEKFLYTGTRKHQKKSDWKTWFPTREEAQAAIDERIAREQEAARVRRIRDAAPELLEALEEAEKHFGPFAEITINGAHDPDDVRVMALIRAAIAKAKGNA